MLRFFICCCCCVLKHAVSDRERRFAHPPSCWSSQTSWTPCEAAPSKRRPRRWSAARHDGGRRSERARRSRPSPSSAAAAVAVADLRIPRRRLPRRARCAETETSQSDFPRSQPAKRRRIRKSNQVLYDKGENWCLMQGVPTAMYSRRKPTTHDEIRTGRSSTQRRCFSPKPLALEPRASASRG